MRRVAPDVAVAVQIADKGAGRTRPIGNDMADVIETARLGSIRRNMRRRAGVTGDAVRVRDSRQ